MMKKLFVVTAVVSVMLIGCGKTEAPSEEVAPVAAIEEVIETEAAETEEVVIDDTTVLEVASAATVETEDVADAATAETEEIAQ